MGTYSPLILKIYYENVVWVNDNFDKILETKIDFTKYLKENCW